MSLLKSPAAFLERAKENGLSEEAVRSLANQQITTLRGLAYCLTLPGTSPTEEQLRNLLNPSEPTAVSRGALSAARMLMFEAQTMSLASLKQTIEHNEDRKVELAPAEREDRIARQKRKLQGLELTGPYDNAHSNYNVVAAMLEANVPIYLEPHKFLTRNAEVARERPGKEVILDEHARLTIRDKAYKDKVAIQTELQLQEALTRRALACDLMGACTYSVMEAWHRFLLSRLSLPPPLNFRKIGMDQLLQAVAKVGAKTRRGLPRTLIPMTARKGKARAFQHRCKKQGSSMSAVRRACAFAGITILRIVVASSLKRAISANVAFIFACVASKRTRCSNARPSHFHRPRWGR